MLDIPQALDLRPIELEDRNAFAEAIEASERNCWSSYFPYLYLRGRRVKRTLLFERLDESILVYALRPKDEKSQLSLFFAPFPFTDAAFKRGVERVQSFNASTNYRIERVQEEEALVLARKNMTISHQAREFVYDRAAVVALAGPDFKRLRKDLSRARRLGSVGVRPYIDSDRPRCLAIVDEWSKRLRIKGILRPGVIYPKSCLKHVGRFPPALLRGLVAEVDGEVRGFAFAGPINRTYGCAFLCITDIGFTGLAYLLRHKMMAEFTDLTYWNSAGDTGRAGLHELKQRFRPVKMLDLYRARAVMRGTATVLASPR